MSSEVFSTDSGDKAEVDMMAEVEEEPQEEGIQDHQEMDLVAGSPVHPITFGVVIGEGVASIEEGVVVGVGIWVEVEEGTECGSMPHCVNM